MNDNEYGRVPFYRTEDGKKELRVSDKLDMADIISVLKEFEANPDAEKIDQIRIVDYENGGITKKIIIADNNAPKEKPGTKNVALAIGIVAFIAAVAVFLCIAR